MFIDLILYCALQGLQIFFHITLQFTVSYCQSRMEAESSKYTINISNDQTLILDIIERRGTNPLNKIFYHSMCKFASRCLTITHLPYAAIKIFDNTPLQLKSSDSTHDQTMKYDLHLLRLRPERQTGINCSKRKVAVAKIPNNQFWEEPDSLFLGTNQMNLLDRSKQIICDLLFNS